MGVTEATQDRAYAWEAIIRPLLGPTRIPRIAELMAADPRRSLGNASPEGTSPKIMANYLYKCRGGDKFANIPQPLNCWLLATALRKDGELWCQGPLLLLAASRFRAYLAFWAILLQVGIQRSLALQLAATAHDAMLNCRIGDDLQAMSNEEFSVVITAAKLKHAKKTLSNLDNPEFLAEQRSISIRRKLARKTWTINDDLSEHFERSANIAWHSYSNNKLPYLIRSSPVLKQVYRSIDNPRGQLSDRLLACLDATLILVNRAPKTSTQFAFGQN